MEAGFTACSDPLTPRQLAQAEKLAAFLGEHGVTCMKPQFLSAGTYVPAKERAEAVNRFFRDPSVRLIFDLSGGDLANETVPYLDYDCIARSETSFWGYSDLTAVLNAVYARTNRSTVLYQARHLAVTENEAQRQMFLRYLNGNDPALFQSAYTFLQGTEAEGVLLGGNLRCLLKLAGTAWWPDFHGALILLEAYGGKASRIAAGFAQLEQIGVFEQGNGVVLGTFTELEAEKGTGSAFELLKMHIPAGLPVISAREIGHAETAKAVSIGTVHRFIQKEELE